MNREDAGLAAVEAVRAALDPEADRVVDEPRGFTWWSHAHALRVHAEAPRADGAVRVVAETGLLAGVGGRGAEFAALARWNAREAALSSLRWDGERGEVSLRASVVAHQKTGDAAARLLAHAALLQVGEALRAADALAIEMPGATLLTAPHPPSAGTRRGASLDPVAQVEAGRAYAAGAASRAVELEQAMAALAALAPAPWARSTRAAHGIDAELLSEVAPPGAPGQGAPWLLRVSASQPHPRLGGGLLTALVPPQEFEPVAGRQAATAALLNEGEAREWTGCDALGGWCVHPAAGLAHMSFIPALALEAGTAERLAWQAGMRARWAAAFLAQVAISRAGRGPAGNPLSD